MFDRGIIQDITKKHFCLLPLTSSEIPESPRNLGITNIDASSVLLQFVPGFSGYTSISRWIVEGETSARAKRQADESNWHVIYETSDPDALALSVSGLTPYTRYRYDV